MTYLTRLRPNVCSRYSKGWLSVCLTDRLTKSSRTPSGENPRNGLQTTDAVRLLKPNRAHCKQSNANVQWSVLLYIAKLLLLLLLAAADVAILRPQQGLPGRWPIGKTSCSLNEAPRYTVRYDGSRLRLKLRRESCIKDPPSSRSSHWVPTVQDGPQHHAPRNSWLKHVLN